MRTKLKGSIVVDARTKELAKRIRPGQIAVICHDDIDGVAADSLIQKRVLAVVNFGVSVTGKYPAKGALRLLRSWIPVFDVPDRQLFARLREGMDLALNLNRNVAHVPQLDLFFPVQPLSRAEILNRLRQAEGRFNETFRNFAANSLFYAQKEIASFCRSLPGLSLRTEMQGRAAVVVARGAGAYEDLAALIPYIQRQKPVLIGVDGGADILLDFGLEPDLIVGDMDSVSETALRRAKELIVHSYPDGYAPGLRRIRALGLPHQLLPCTGTSEDACLMLAFEKKAEPVILVGSHADMIDFLEKGRKGMGSTLLTRMKMGHVLVDSKGIHLLYPSRPEVRLSYLLMASVLPFMAILAASPQLRLLAHAMWLNIKMFWN